MNVVVDGVDIRWSQPMVTVADRPEPFLGPADRLRAAAFRRAADRNRFVTGRALLADYVRDELGCGPDDYEVHRPTDRAGEWRPVLQPLRPGLPRPPGFSIAHSGDRVVLAVARNPALGNFVGVDVEQVPTDAHDGQLTDEVAAHVLTPTELVRLPVDPTGRRVSTLRSFVRKEAVLKAVGFGLAIDPKMLEIEDSCAGPVLVRFDSPHAAPLRLIDLDIGVSFLACLAISALPPADSVNVDESRPGAC